MKNAAQKMQHENCNIKNAAQSMKTNKHQETMMKWHLPLSSACHSCGPPRCPQEVQKEVSQAGSTLGWCQLSLPRDEL